MCCNTNTSVCANTQGYTDAKGVQAQFHSGLAQKISVDYSLRDSFPLNLLEHPL